MKEYIILARELFNIKKGILVMIIKRNKDHNQKNREIMLETGNQLRVDLEQLKTEQFLDVTVSDGDKRLIKKINAKIMIKYAVMRRRFEREIDNAA